MEDYKLFLESRRYEEFISISDEEIVATEFNFVNLLFPLGNLSSETFVFTIRDLREDEEFEDIKNKMRRSLSMILEKFCITETGINLLMIPIIKGSQDIFTRIIKSLVHHDLIEEASLLTFRLSRFRYHMKLVNNLSYSPWEIAYTDALNKVVKSGCNHREAQIVKKK